MRSFIAITLNEETKAALAPLQRTLSVGRLVPPENLHLTLLFLDEQTENMLEALHEELLEISEPSFELSFSQLVNFGQVLAVEVAASATLNTLHQRIKAAVRRAGIELPRRRFRPHVTIARLKKPQTFALHQDQSTLWPNVLQNMIVTEFRLYQSTLRPVGARHQVLAQYPLCAAPEYLVQHPAPK